MIDGNLTTKSRRILRVEKVLRQIIGQYLMSINSLFNGVMVTVIKTTCTSDLKSANVYISIYNTNDNFNIEDIFNVLEERRALIQHKIGKELPIKFCPRLKFILDNSIDKLTHLSKLLNTSRVKSMNNTSIKSK